MVSDILVKLLKYLYSNVPYVSNITDIDDKIIAASHDQKFIKELTSKYEKIYNDNLKDLGIHKPDLQPRATEHIEEMIDQINELITNGHVYEKERHVLFNVNIFQNMEHSKR